MFLIVDYIGFLGPFILILMTLYYFTFMSHTISFTAVYILGYLANMALNFILKNVIREPRPVDEKSILPIGRLSIDTYGMPSGHAQNCGFLLGYVSLVLKNITFIYIIIITCYKFIFIRQI